MARLRWGLQTFGDSFALTTSFGIQSAVLLHMVSRISAAIPVIWVDTGYLPAETYRYAETLCQLLKLNLQVAQPEQSSARMEALAWTALGDRPTRRHGSLPADAQGGAAGSDV